MRRDLEREFESAAEACRELVCGALAESLAGSLKGLGYLVGMGMEISEADAAQASEKIFARFKNIVGLTLARADDPRRNATLDFVANEQRERRAK